MSDNCTNVIGADRELRDLLHNVQNDRVANLLSQQSIEWKFNHPSSL